MFLLTRCRWDEQYHNIAKAVTFNIDPLLCWRITVFCNKLFSNFWFSLNCDVLLETDLSHARRIQLATIHSESMITTSTVPGQIVINVLNTKRVLKSMRLRAPMLRDDASENRRLCSSRTVHTSHYQRTVLLSTVIVVIW